MALEGPGARPGGTGRRAETGAPRVPGGFGQQRGRSARGAWHTGQSLRSGPTKSELRTIS